MRKKSSSEKQEGACGLLLPCPRRDKGARTRGQRKRKQGRNMGGVAGEVRKEKINRVPVMAKRTDFCFKELLAN